MTIRSTTRLTRRFVLVTSLALAAAGATSTIAAGQSAPTSATPLRGAGSTFAAPLYKKWIEEYSVGRNTASITYDAVGSGEGVRRFIAGTVDFAGSDEIITEAEAAKLDKPAVTVPITAGMIVLAYNIPGVKSEIRLPRDVYPDIFAGRIKRWDDPRIQAANPGLALPSRDISLVARLDSSGTTAAFTKHLAAVDPNWRDKGMGVGKLIDWPQGTMLVSGNEGVAGRIKISEGAIGYVEYWFAQRLGLRIAALQNKSESYVTPTARAGELALSARVANVKELDVSVMDPTAVGAYPITTYSWMLLHPRYADPAKGQALRDFAEWTLSQPGQNYAAQLGYLPLTDDITAISKTALAGLSF
ncbi:MAG: phosphate ABC transporter substrate-binding protein PstS [Methylacidiphilales bacterium]|nr:phosphate ABC transporter substrate-binding protein PstS [Candidatus Methylacidiphilales bacterium]